MKTIAIWAVGVLVAVGLVYMIKLAGEEHNNWKMWCYEQGGRVDSTSKVHTGTTVVNGKVGTTTTTSTTYYCLTEDGRILDVK